MREIRGLHNHLWAYIGGAMGERELQHWVPQHHMRLFAGSRRRIGLATRKGGLTVPDASIRHQCARHMFYGDKAIEAALGRLECQHAIAYRAALRHAWDSGPPLSPMQLYQLREALVLQHGRTPSQVAVSAASMDQMQLHLYAEHLRAKAKSKRSRALLRAIEEGRARLKRSKAFALQLALAAVEETTPLAMDLTIRVVRNQTGVPFLLGDAPCIYSNNYQREVTSHGVLGVTSQGLMITMPLDSTTCLIVADPEKYKFHQRGTVVDLEDEPDVLRLNRLQAFASEECLYFANPGGAAIARDALDTCPESESSQRGGFQVLERVESGESKPRGTETFRPVQGNQIVARGELLMIFQRQLPETLDLSLFDTLELERPAKAYGPRIRSLVEEYEDANLSLPTGPVSIDELVRNVEAQLEVW